MSARRLWLAVLVTAVIVRLLTLSAYPLYDTTEARYAEIARLMVISSDWITPQIESGVPFWAKPPLSIWMTAASFRMLGFSEFAARLPAFLMMLASALVTCRIGRTLYAGNAATITGAVLFTSALGFVASGAVMTDATLLLATTLSMASFCLVIRDPDSVGRYGLFVGLGLGLLAKGPIALVLVAVPICLWTLCYKKLRWLWHTIPWVSGSMLMLAIAAPWYVLAEINSPGFLEYFLLGEHWLRFVESGWQGDLYGSAHSRPRGTIWLFGIAATLPWSIVAMFAIANAFKAKPVLRPMPSVQGFLLLWALAPMLFFSFAGNILPAYVLPGLPAFALLLGDWLSRQSRIAAHAGWLVPGLVATIMLSGFPASIAHKSQRDLVEYHYDNSPSSTLYYFPKPPASASFYSSGRAQAMPSEVELRAYLASTNAGFIALQKRSLDKIPGRLAGCLDIRKEFHDYLLLIPARHCDRF